MRSLSQILMAALAVVGLSGGPAAQAATLHWRFDGLFTYVDPALSTPPQVSVGLPWTVWLKFDTAAPFTFRQADGDGDGALYRFAASSVQMAIAAGSLGPFQWDNEEPNDRIIVRDNYKVGGVDMDGMSFASTDYGGPNGQEYEQLGLILRGPVLNLLNLDFNQPMLPGSLPPGLAGLDTSLLQICNGLRGDNNQCTRGLIQGDVTSVRALAVDDPQVVPLPTSLALVGLGLVLLSLPRRARVPGSCA